MRTSLLAAFLLPTIGFCQSDLEILSNYMQGSFSSAEQAELDTNYFNIELEMVRIWPNSDDGVWLYIEQAAATKKEEPYRQRIYHVQEVDGTTFTSTMYKIINGKDWYGSFTEPARFDDLALGSLELIPGCALTMRSLKNHFEGNTNERDCTNAWGDASYATSEVKVYRDRLISWDRGWNDQGEQVWGAENGGYIFLKKE
jgi:hypothetical protein